MSKEMKQARTAIFFHSSEQENLNSQAHHHRGQSRAQKTTEGL